MSSHLEVTFNTNTGAQKFAINLEAVIDPNTGFPYEFAQVHGRTWQITFFPVILDINEAFTPCPSEYNHRGTYRFNRASQVYEPYNPVLTKQISFHTPNGIIEFNVKPDSYTDPNTGKPYPYVNVHGNTWQTEFFSELPKEEAFTPCANNPTDHRGTYYYCPEFHAYIKMDYL